MSRSPPAATVLVIEDEPQIRRVVLNAFVPAGSNVIEAATGAAGIELVASMEPDLVILDLGLPDLVGVEVCRKIRSASSVPILVLSARHSEQEKVALLDAGADDYVTKPFSTEELLARARALLRRAQRFEPDDAKIEIGGLMLDPGARLVMRDGQLIHLTPIEWGLLRELMVNAGRTLTHQHLFTRVWSGRQFGDAQQYLRVYVAHLRRKIEPDSVRPRYLHTVPGVGYRFAAPTDFKPPAPRRR